jgi:manganese transport protein
VLLTGADVLLLLALIHLGFRKLEALVIVLVTTIGACFAYNIWLAHPDWGAVARGTVVPNMPDMDDALKISLGILGATVMPHNLYLHSSIVQTRRFARDDEGKRGAIRFNTIDTVVALGLAFFVNAAILILAAAVFHKHGPVEELEDAHRLLTPLLGGAAATTFAVALLCSGQSSTITGTLAGQIVMEGFLKIRIKPWLRRMITRSLAIIPALILVLVTGGHRTVDMLLVSQIVLSMQLPFAIFPLMMVTSSRSKMGAFANPPWVIGLGYAICTVIAALNVKLLWDKLGPVWVGVIAVIMVGYAIGVYLWASRSQNKTTPSA